MIGVGIYKEFYNGEYELPSIRDAIYQDTVSNKRTLVSYLKKGKPFAAAPAINKDVLSGERIPGELLMLTDGVYEWRSDLVYYIEKYNLKLPDDFIKHVLDQQDVND